MDEPATNRYEVVGYILWLVGIVLFGAAAIRERDLLTFTASALFLAGIIAVLIPMIREFRRTR